MIACIKSEAINRGLVLSVGSRYFQAVASSATKTRYVPKIASKVTCINDCYVREELISDVVRNVR